MKLHYKIGILLLFTTATLIGFLIKIPMPLRGHDKLLHTTFYFVAAIFINLLFKNCFIPIFIALVLFGITIEYVQPIMNKFTHTKVHGRFDIEDIKANVKGLMLYSIAHCIGYIIFIVLGKVGKQSRTKI